MTPRFKGDPRKLDLSTPCPLCGYGIPPAEIVRLDSRHIRCAKCGGEFDALAGVKVQSTS